MRIMQATLQLCFAAMFCSGAFGQTPLATTEVAGYTLELWAYELTQRKFSDVPGLDLSGNSAGPDMSFLLGPDAPTVPDIPWESERRRPGRGTEPENRLALGLLLREPNGTISQAGCNLSAAAQVEIAGQVLSQKPFAMRKPTDKYSTHSWTNRALRPLVVSIGSHTAADLSQLSRLTGFVTISPRLSADIEFTPAELESKQRKSAGLFSIEPAGSQSMADGTVYQFELFAPKPKQSGNRRSPEAKLEQAMMQLNTTLPEIYIESESGERIPPGGQMRVSVSRQRQQSLRTSLRNEMRLRNQEPQYRDMERQVTFKYELDVDVFAVKIPRAKVKRVVLSPSVATGMPTTLQFEFTSLDLSKSYSPDEVARVIEQGKQAPATQSNTHMAHSGVSGERIEISVTEFRTWQDASGKFSVDATLVAAEGDKVKLKKRDGSTISVPLSRLSMTDIAYVEAVNKRK